MVKLVDLTGEVIGEWTVIRRYTDKMHPTRWVCICSCGNTHNVLARSLKDKSSTNCGCKTPEKLSVANKKHGGASDGCNTPEYQSFIAMMHRCYNPDRVTWDNYGARGITVEEESWLEESPNGFLNFLRDMGIRPIGHSLDRIDVNKGYSIDNCRWADSSTQAYNRRVVKTEKNTSKYRGVSYARDRREKWVARIGDGSNGYVWIGSYTTPEEAALAYNKKAIEMHGSNAILNEIEDYKHSLQMAKDADIILALEDF